MSSVTSPLFGGDNSAPSTTVTSWNRINASYPSSWTTASEGVRTTPVGGAITISNFYIQLDVAPGAGASYTFTLMKNGSATSVQVVISNSGTSGTDSSNSASFAAGDTVSLQCVPSAGTAPATTNAQQWNFVVATSDLTAPLLSSFSGASNSATQYGGLTAGSGAASGWSGTETDSQILVPTAGTISNFYARLSGTSGASKSYQFTLMQNGSATSLDITISGVTSTGNDTTHSVSVSAGDSLTIRSIPTNTPTAQTSMAFGMVFTPTTPGESFFGFGSANLPSASVTNFEQVIGIGNNSWVSTESGRILVPGPWTFKKIYVKHGTAPGVGNTRTIALRKAGATTGLSVAISGASTTGNTASDVTYTQGDTITYTSTIAGTPAADTGGVHTGVLVYAAPTSSFVPIVMVY